jgi:hypothetical protein
VEKKEELKLNYNKYKNIKTEINGKTLDSKREAKRYSELLLLERAKEIKDLQLQVKYELQEGYKLSTKQVRPIIYIADFVYYDNGLKKWVIEDVKGMRTEVYKLKKKLFEYKYKIEIHEI